MKRLYPSILFSFLLLYQSTYVIAQQPTQEWVREYDGRGNGTDNLNSMVVDQNGNIYITGNHYSNSPYYLETVKYNSSGVQQWTASKEHAQVYSFAGCKNIAVDGNANIYIAGSINSGNSSNFITIKYSPAGNELWAVQYTGTSGGGGNAIALALDKQGNIYVTGSSPGIYGDDYATIKYNSSGVQQWVRRYNGTGNGADVPSAMDIDTVGNIYVTGYSYTDGTNIDCATIKYNSAGIQQWVSRFGIPGNNNEYPNDIVVDAAGNAYITGYTTSLPNYTNKSITIKYAANGVQQWAQIYNGSSNNNNSSRSIKLDHSGNVLITGSDFNNIYNIFIINYSQSGILQWVSGFNDINNYGSGPSSMALDNSGNIYVTGSKQIYPGYDSTTFCTIKYNQSGVQQWVNNYRDPQFGTDNGRCVAIDSSGNIIAAGQAYFNGIDLFTIKYNAAGTELWKKRYNGISATYDAAKNIAVSPSGFIYVAGSSQEDSTAYDMTLIKYSQTGESQWILHYNSPLNGDNFERAMVLDGSGNICITGDDGHYLTTLKVAESGAILWTAVSNLPAYAAAIAADSSGNVYVTGYGVDSNYVSSYITIKYNSAGILQWTKRYHGSGNYASPSSIGVDRSGNIYVTGTTIVSTNESDFSTIKYSPAGALLWVQNYNFNGNSDNAHYLAIDRSGNVYVTGDSRGANQDFATVKYNSAGIQQWVQRFNGEENSQNIPSQIITDSMNNVYVTGTSGTPYGYGSSICCTIKYNSAGIMQWTSLFSDFQFNYSSAITLDKYNNIYITGANENNKGDALTVKYNNNGVQQWVMTYNDRYNYSDEASSIAIDNSQNVFIAGKTSDINTNTNFLVIKYSQVIGIKQISDKVPINYSLSQNYPNPFNPSTKIKFDIPSSYSSQTEILVYDILGKKVASLVNESLKPGSYEVEWDASNFPSGVYFYRLKTENFNQSKKMMLIK